MKEKACRVCGRTLPLEDFPKTPSCRDGHAGECVYCKRERNREYMRQKRANDPEWERAIHRKYRQRNKEYQRRRYQELRAEVLREYGGACACCGETTVAFLTIDHVFNDGNKHRSKGERYSGVGIYRWLKKAGFPKDGRFQVLCYNCNCAKQHDRDGHRAAHPNAYLIDGGDDA